MDEQAISSDRVAIWMSMAEHFLDTETRQGIPETARLCVASGLTVEQAQDIWCHEVSPAVSFNLYLVAGEWAAWDESWLVESIQKRRARPRGRFRRFFDRGALRNGVWRSIERCMHALRAVPPDERAELTSDLCALARHFFDFAPQELTARDDAAFKRMVRASSVAVQVLAPASVAGTYATCCQRMLAALNRTTNLDERAQP